MKGLHNDYVTRYFRSGRKTINSHNVIKQFITHIDTHFPFVKGKRLLLAVSGGVDSMVMAYLFQKTNLDFAVIHCNFKLRKDESDADALFVQSFCEKNKITCFIKSFRTKEYAKQNGISIQMAARELRYHWFKTIAAKEKYDFIVLAHHKDDAIETFFINLMRGTGIEGLAGIKSQENIFLRPLLFASREQIEDFAVKMKIHFREDSSNLKDIYLRNWIRLKLLPLIKETEPSFDTIMQGNIKRLYDAKLIYRESIERTKNEVVKNNGNQIVINIDEVQKNEYGQTLLYEILKKYNFSESLTQDIYEARLAESGKRFYSLSHRLIKNRKEWILETIRTEKPCYAEVGSNDFFVNAGHIRLRFSKEQMPVAIEKSEDVAQLDFEKLQFPLKIRPWKKGDRFIPLGMKKEKKISDLLIDLKKNLFDKENVMVVCSEEIIIWVVGVRMDERYKVGPQTKNVFKIEITGKGDNG